MAYSKTFDLTRSAVMIAGQSVPVATKRIENDQYKCWYYPPASGETFEVSQIYGTMGFGDSPTAAKAEFVRICIRNLATS